LAYFRDPPEEDGDGVGVSYKKQHGGEKREIDLEKTGKCWGEKDKQGKKLEERRDARPKGKVTGNQLLQEGTRGLFEVGTQTKPAESWKRKTGRAAGRRRKEAGKAIIERDKAR